MQYISKVKNKPYHLTYVFCLLLIGITGAHLTSKSEDLNLLTKVLVNGKRIHQIYLWIYFQMETMYLIIKVVV